MKIALGIILYLAVSVAIAAIFDIQAEGVGLILLGGIILLANRMSTDPFFADRRVCYFVGFLLGFCGLLILLGLAPAA